MKILTPKLNWQTYNFGQISLCMIMRNDAKVLGRCLASVRGLINECIIVDTGSTDNSIEIAKSWGCVVLKDLWQDDFARPRNIGIRKATKDWILILDPDEIIQKKDHVALKLLTRQSRYHSYWLTTYNYGPQTFRLDYKLVGKEADPLKKYPGYVPSTKTRFFKNGYGVQFEGCWHELADWYLRRKKLLQGSTTVPVHHWTGEISQANGPAKKAFYLKMGEKKVREWPNHPQARWELATAEMSAGLRERASKTLAIAWKLGFSRQDMFYNLAKCQRLLGNKEKGDLAFEKGVCKQYPALTHVNPVLKPMAVLLEGL